jgi:hypothetical protein
MIGDVEQGEAGGDPVVPAVGGQDIGDCWLVGYGDSSFLVRSITATVVECTKKPGGAECRTLTPQSPD